MQFDGTTWNFGAPSRCWTLLALIAIARGPASRAGLASELWPEELETAARANVRRYLHRIRINLPPPIDGVEWLAVDSHGVRWNEEAALSIDVVAFETLVSDPHRRAEAIELYRGDLLEGMFDECLLADRERLRSLYVDACGAEALTARQALDFAKAARYVDRILAVDEWREDALRLGMAIRYESGDRSSALAQFERFSTRLASEIGVDPMPETLALRDAILTNASIHGLRAIDPSAQDDSSIQAEPRLPFVGRDAETATLHAAWRRSAGGRGTTLFLGGVAGIGKSRLAAEFASSVSAQGGRVLFGETSNPQAYPYEPVVNALRQGLALLAESPIQEPWLSALAEVLPELHAAFPGLTESAALDPDKARTRLLEAIARAIERLAKVRPLLLVLEDVQWAQPATLDVIATLARRIGAVPALLVVTHRTGETGPGHNALHALQTRWLAERLASSLDLQPLPSADVRTLVEKTAPAGTVAGDIAGAIADRSGGNPLFIGQLLSSYAETGELRESEIVRTIVDRLALLDAKAMSVGQTAAAIGRSFSIDLVSDVLGWSEGETLDALGGLLDRGLVRASGSSAFSFAFAHALIETAVYGTMPQAERALRHRRIAGLLSRQGRNEPHMLGTIARHWNNSGEPQRAGAAYAGAAQAALDVYARAEAIELARSALTCGLMPQARYSALLLVSKASPAFAEPAEWKRDIDALYASAETLDAHARFDARQELVRYLSQVGDRDAQRAAIEEMLAMAGQIGSGDLRVKALHELALLDFLQGRLSTAMSTSHEALAIATAAGDESSEGLLRHLMVSIALRLNDYAAVDEHVAVLTELAARNPAHERRVRVLECKQYAAMETSDAKGCKEAGEELLKIADAIGDSRMEVNARAALSMGALRLGSMREMREQLELAIAVCERLVLANHAIGFKINRAVFELHVGNAHQSLAAIDHVLPALEKMGAGLHLCTAYYTRSEALLLLGDRAGALQNALKANELANATGARGFIAGTLLRLGTATCASGDFDAGLHVLREAVAIRREGSPAVRLLDALCGYLQALLDAHRIDAAEPVAQEIETLYERHPDSVWRPTFVLSLLGQTAAMAGRAAAARAFFNRGRAVLRREIERLDDREAATAFRALPFHRPLLEVRS